MAIIASKDKEYQGVVEAIRCGQSPSDFGKDHEIQQYKWVYNDLSVMLLPTCSLMVLQQTHLVIPREARSSMVDVLHSKHFSLSGMSATPCSCLYWPHMIKELVDVWESYQICQMVHRCHKPTVPIEDAATDYKVLDTGSND